jgi:hypothetical protein
VDTFQATTSKPSSNPKRSRHTAAGRRCYPRRVIKY